MSGNDFKNVEPKQVHAVLDYLLNKAAISGKVHDSTIYVDYYELCEAYKSKPEQLDEVRLKIRIELEWV